MSPPSVAVIVLNTNRRDDTLECLASLARNDLAGCTVVLLDNASTDGSVEAVRAAHPWVEIIRLSENLGYAGNNNVGLKWALDRRFEWLVLLNEDTVLAPDCLARLVEAGGTDSSIGVVGPMVYHHDEPEVIQSAGGVLGRRWESSHAGENQIDRNQFPTSRDVDWISGCCIMLRHPALEQAGLIDQRYFYYWEETELCIRIRKLGWRIVQVPGARLWHKGVQRDYRPKPSVTYYATRNRLLTLSKHKAPVRVRIAAWGEILRTMTSWSLRPRWRDRRSHRDAMLMGIRDALLNRWGKMPEA